MTVVDIKAPSPHARLSPVDGVRAITHFSLLALHAAMLTTGQLPSDGPLIKAIKNSPIFNFFQAGGVQVDVMLMLSGFLLVHNLLQKDATRAKDTGFLEHLLSRMCRLVPSMVLSLLLGHLAGDCWDAPYNSMVAGGAPVWKRVASILFFYTNYCSQTTHGSFIGSLTWSCCVDMHCGIIVFLLIKAVLTLKQNIEYSSLLKLLRWIFAVLTVISVVIRALIFEKDTTNLLVFGKYSHFGLLQGPGSYQWFMDVYDHKWLTENSASAISKIYVDNMYSPTHTRFGPFMVGGFLACSYLLVVKQHKEKDVSRNSFSVVALLLTLLSAAQLVMPCLPAPPVDETPLETQYFVTIAIRVLSSIAAAFLLFRALVPSSHAWHSPVLNSLLSMKIWKRISDISYCSYLLHFRMMLELVYSKPLRGIFGLALPGVLTVVADPENTALIADLAGAWIQYICKLFLVGTILSFAVSFVMHETYEKPCSSYLNSLVRNTRRSTVVVDKQLKEN